MLIDARELQDEHVIESDICIVGGGAAGISMALALAGTPWSVTLLESGGFEYDEAVQALYDGQNDGVLLEPGYRYISRSRWRYFGGATNAWTGLCVPLGTTDFHTRPWFPDSGWPITQGDLTSFYQDAARLLRIDPVDPDADLSGEPLLPLPSFTSMRYQLSGVRFGRDYRQELLAVPNLTVAVHANATAFETDETGGRVQEVRVATLNGTRLTAQARLYVLATGGIENARLLLVSDSVQRTGLGNRDDLVGRYFMEHLEGTIGVMILSDQLEAIERFGPTPEHLFRGFTLSAAAREREHLLNASIEIEFEEPYRPESPLGGTPLALDDAIHRLDHLDRRLPVETAYSLCFARAEQSPNPESRVTLLPEVDALGMRRTHLDWRLHERDHLSLRRTMERMAQELGAQRIGRGMVLLSDDDPWRRVHESNHHMGTTRMSSDPRTGVVNGDGRLHDVDNLYVAGSSLFPTVGAANPTLTIVALAVRQAQHLQTVLARG